MNVKQWVAVKIQCFHIGNLVSTCQHCGNSVCVSIDNVAAAAKMAAVKLQAKLVAAAKWWGQWGQWANEQTGPKRQQADKQKRLLGRWGRFGHWSQYTNKRTRQTNQQGHWFWQQGWGGNDLKMPTSQWGWLANKPMRPMSQQGYWCWGFKSRWCRQGQG